MPPKEKKTMNWVRMDMTFQYLTFDKLPPKHINQLELDMTKLIQWILLIYSHNQYNVLGFHIHTNLSMNKTAVNPPKPIEVLNDSA